MVGAVEHIQRIAELRLAVGFLGEQQQAACWKSSFLGRNASAFLGPVFGKNAAMAQYNGLTEAACRVHDERIGVGRVFHLFRLPEIIEQRIFEAFEQSVLTEAMIRRFGSTEAAEKALVSITERLTDPKEGPVNLGSIESIDSHDGLPTLAAYYLAAFRAGIQCFPYFNDSR